MNDLPEPLKNTILLADHDAEMQKLVVDAVEKIVVAYLQRNMYELSVNLVTHQQNQIGRLALRALKNHLNNASNIY